MLVHFSYLKYATVSLFPCGIIKQAKTRSFVKWNKLQYGGLSSHSAIEAVQILHPEITEVMFDSKMMFEITLDSINISEKGYDTVWDTIMFDCMWKYFQDGSSNRKALKSKWRYIKANC